MKLTSVLSLSLISASLLFTACKKTEEPVPEAVPVADFSFNKGEYTEGETVTLNSTSTNGSTFRWTSPDGTTGKGASFSYAIPREAFDRSLNFRLEAVSPSGLKSDYTVKSVKVKAARGKIVFYGGFSTSIYSISIDGVKLGDYYLPATGFPVPVPECDAAGYPTTTAIVGKHIVTYQYGNIPRSKEVTVTENNCSPLQLD